MELYHKALLVGIVQDVSVEGIHMSGEIELLPDRKRYQEFFSFLTDDEMGLDEEPPFSEDLLDAESWWISDRGQRRAIDIPAVHDDGTIYWVWSTS